MIDGILSVLGTILYPLFSFIFMLIDLLQDIFYKLAGVGTVSVNGVAIGAGNSGENTDNGLIFYLLQSDVIKNLFFSILLLAVFLIVIFTAMAFIKNSYTAKPKKWQDIIVSMFKGVANFVFIPVMCLLGVWVGNILLNAINGATSASGESSLSGQLFVVSAYNANKIRSGDRELNEGLVEDLFNKGQKVGITVDKNKKTGDGDTAVYDTDYYADKMDEIFSMKATAKTAHWSVEPYYSLIGINYIILAAGGIIILNVLISISFGMVKRMIYLLALFVISPATCAMYPLDDGKAVGSWKDQFVKQTLGAYSAVAGMNLMFSILPLVEQIDLQIFSFGIIPFLLSVAALYMVKDIIGLVNGFVGGENALAAGEGLRKSTLGTAKKGLDKVRKGGSSFVKGTAKAVGAAKAAKKAGANGASAFFKSGMASIGMTAVNAIPGSKQAQEWGKSVKEAGKAGADKYNEKTGNALKEQNEIAEQQGDFAAAMSANPDTDISAFLSPQFAEAILAIAAANKGYSGTNEQLKTDEEVTQKAQKATTEYNDAVRRKAELEKTGAGSIFEGFVNSIKGGTAKGASELQTRLDTGKEFTYGQINAATGAKKDEMLKFNEFLREYQGKDANVAQKKDNVQAAYKDVVAKHSDTDVKNAYNTASADVAAKLSSLTEITATASASISAMITATNNSLTVQRDIRAEQRTVAQNTAKSADIQKKAAEMAKEKK